MTVYLSTSLVFSLQPEPVSYKMYTVNKVIPFIHRLSIDWGEEESPVKVRTGNRNSW